MDKGRLEAFSDGVIAIIIMVHPIQKVNGSILLANLHLLFWLSLIPFVTGWMGKTSLPLGRSRCTARFCSWLPSLIIF